MPAKKKKQKPDDDEPLIPEWPRASWPAVMGSEQAWLKASVWKVLATVLRPGSASLTLELEDGRPISSGTLETFRLLLAHHQLHAAALDALGDRLPTLFTPEFREIIERARRKTEILMQELHWTLGGKLEKQLIPVRGAAVGQLYPFGGASKNRPRLLTELTLWAQTMSAREEILKYLTEAGYAHLSKPREFVLRKTTGDIEHEIRVRSTLWEGTKSWPTDLERNIWDRAIPSATTGTLRPELSDLFLLACRHFSLDGLCGNASDLLDVLLILEQFSDTLDWARIRSVLGAVHRPDWFWAALLAVSTFEDAAGRKFDLPAVMREKLEQLRGTFWEEFIASRVFWPSPDGKASEFTRAYVKLLKGV